MPSGLRVLQENVFKISQIIRILKFKSHLKETFVSPLLQRRSFLTYVDTYKMRSKSFCHSVFRRLGAVCKRPRKTRRTYIALLKNKKSQTPCRRVILATCEGLITFSKFDSKKIRKLHQKQLSDGTLMWIRDRANIFNKSKFLTQFLGNLS